MKKDKQQQPDFLIHTGETISVGKKGKEDLGWTIFPEYHVGKLQVVFISGLIREPL